MSNQQEVTKVSILVAFQGPQPPAWFVTELATSIRATVNDMKEAYQIATGLGLEMQDTPGVDRAALTDPRIDADPAKLDLMVKALMDIADITEAEALAILKDKDIPPEISEKFVQSLVDAGKSDEFGATEGCQCDGCKRRREHVTKAREARLN